MKRFRTSLLLLLLIVFLPVASDAETPLPEPGKKLVPLRLPAPADPAGKKNLGLADPGTEFTLSDLKTELVLIEVIGVYCPQCFKQAPEFNKLYERLNKGKMKGRVAMFALAAGGAEPEIEQLLQSGQYAFPVVADTTYEAHKRLGEPKTPFTILCRPDGPFFIPILGSSPILMVFTQRSKGSSASDDALSAP
nr:TlpA family protein disulfide reductase [Desulfobacula sp.]